MDAQIECDGLVETHENPETFHLVRFQALQLYRWDVKIQFDQSIVNVTGDENARPVVLEKMLSFSSPLLFEHCNGETSQTW